MRGTEEKEVRREEGGERGGETPEKGHKMWGKREEGTELERSGSDRRRGQLRLAPNRPSLRNISSLFTAACSGHPSERERGQRLGSVGNLWVCVEMIADLEISSEALYVEECLRRCRLFISLQEFLKDCVQNVSVLWVWCKVISNSRNCLCLLLAGGICRFLMHFLHRFWGEMNKQGTYVDIFIWSCAGTEPMWAWLLDKKINAASRDSTADK